MSKNFQKKVYIINDEIGEISKKLELLENSKEVQEYLRLKNELNNKKELINKDKYLNSCPSHLYVVINVRAHNNESCKTFSLYCIKCNEFIQNIKLTSLKISESELIFLKPEFYDRFYELQDKLKEVKNISSDYKELRKTLSDKEASNIITKKYNTTF